MKKRKIVAGLALLAMITSLFVSSKEGNKENEYTKKENASK